MSFDVPENVMKEFADELARIRIATEMSASLVPERIANLGKQLAQSYQYPTGPSRPTTTTAPGTPVFSGSRSGWSTLDNVDATVADLRAEAHRQAQEQYPNMRPRGRGASGRVSDINENETEGLTSTGTKIGERWQDRVQLSGLGEVLPLPRYPGAEPNAADLLNYLSTVSANIAYKRQQKLNQKSLGARQEWGATNEISLDESGFPTGELTPEQQADFDSLTKQTRVGGLSNLFSAGESGYAQGRYIKGILSRIARPLTQNMQYGYETGFEGGAPTFFGIRSPFAGALGAGVGQKASQFGFALGNNVTPGQAATIYNNLFSQGWYGGGSTDAMRVAAANMTQQNPYIGQMSQYFEMMDRATRFGAASLDQFNAVMKQIPDAAKTAHVSITDMMSQMDQLGQYNTTTGGTYQQGIQNATAWASAVGLPPAIMSQLMQNPLVIGQTFAATGLMPQMQGLASPYQHAQGIFGALNLLNRAIIAPKDRSTIDPITGLSQTISGQSQKEALLAKQLGIPQDQVHSMLANQKGMMVGMQMWNASQAYRGTVLGDVQHGDMQGAYNALVGAPWQRLKGALGQAKDSQGHYMFEDWTTFKRLKGQGISDARAHQLAQGTARQDIANAGDTDILHHASAAQLAALGVPMGMNGLPNLHGLSGQQRAHLAQQLLKRGDVSGTTMAAVARDRQSEIQKYIRQNTQKFGPGNQQNNGPTLQIELGPAAKKMFHLTDPTRQQKAAVNAGTASVDLNSWVNGPTVAPYPDMNTASGAGTFDYTGLNNPNTTSG